MMGKAAGSRPAKACKQSGAIAVPIRPLLKNHAFGPDEIRVLTTAFEDTLRTLRLANRGDPATEIIARKITSAIPSNCVNARLTFCHDRLAGVIGRRQKASRPP